jgi:hypothetical protein
MSTRRDIIEMIQEIDEAEDGNVDILRGIALILNACKSHVHNPPISDPLTQSKPWMGKLRSMIADPDSTDRIISININGYSISADEFLRMLVNLKIKGCLVLSENAISIRAVAKMIKLLDSIITTVVVDTRLFDSCGLEDSDLVKMAGQAPRNVIFISGTDTKMIDDRLPQIDRFVVRFDHLVEL